MSRIDSSRLSSPRTAVTGHGAGRAATGSLHGQSVSVVARLQQTGASAYLAAGGVNHANAKPLSQRQVRREGRPGRLLGKQSAGFLRATGNAQAASVQALGILRDRRIASNATGRRGVVNKYLGTARALRAVQTDVDDLHRMALLCPFRHAPETPRELFTLLNGASPEALEEMAEDLAGVDVFKRPPDRLKLALDAVRYNQRELFAFLQESLGLPHSAGHNGYPGSADEWAKRLEEAASDGEAAAILGELDGLNVTPQLVKILRNASGNPRELHHRLRDALGLSRQDEKSALAGLLQALEDDLHEQELANGSRIRASLDAGDIAAKAGGTEDANALLDSWTDMLYGATGFGDAAGKMIRHFGLHRLPATVGLMQGKLQTMRDTLESMKQELGGKMQQGIPGDDKVQLGAVIRALSHIHVLTTLTETIGSFVRSAESMARSLETPSADLDASVLLGGLMNIVTSSRIHPGQYEDLLKDLGVNDIGNRILVLQGIKSILRSLPDKAYSDDKALSVNISAAQAVLDDAIRKEEESIDGATIGKEEDFIHSQLDSAP